MLPTFIDKVIDEILVREKGNDFSRFQVVFPTRRASLIFKNQFALRIKKAAFLPQSSSIGDFISSHYPRQIADRKELLLELFSIYITYFPHTSYSLFVPWGEMLLNDFDEIERYHVNASTLYSGILSLKEIDTLFENDPEQNEQIKKFWSLFTDQKPSLLQQKFVQTWEVLPLMYEQLNEQLAAKNKATEGRAYREMATHPAHFLSMESMDGLVLAGFYALTRSEELLLSYISENKGLLLWDADTYYTSDLKQEAGFFFRSNKLTQGDFTWKGNYFKDHKKSISVTGTPLAAGQIKHLAETLQKLVAQKEINLNKTVVLLPDESMLALLLQSLPPEIKEINVTMGFPFTETLLYRFLLQIQQLKKSTQHINGEIYLQSATWVEIHKHPYAKAFFKDTSAFPKNSIKLFIPVSDLHLEASDLLNLMSPKNTTASSTFDSYIQVLQTIVSFLEKLQEPTQKEITSFILKEVRALKILATPYLNTLDVQAAEMLIKDIFDSTRIPFSGDPVQGLQVMGFLESRSLDFENVFIVNVNEGSLPRHSRHHSFIPYALRKGFGLPTYEEQDAISSYHFWRLLQRAENIHLIYNTQVNNFSGGEKSRYLLQLFYEMHPALPETLSLNHQLIRTPLVHYPVVKPEYLRNDALTIKLTSLFTDDSARPFSATSLQSFIHCSLQFYFRYVENIKEPELDSEEIDGALFGTLFHKVVSALYLPYQNLLFSREIAGTIKKHIHQEVTQAIRTSYDKHYNGSGYAFLIGKIIERYTEQVLDLDLTSEAFKPISFEKNFQAILPLQDHKTAVIKGTFDRLDKMENAYRIVDYKTGNDSVEKPKTMGDLFTDTRYKINLQLLLYSWMAVENKMDLPVIAGIYPLRRISNGIEMLDETGAPNQETLQQFSMELKALIEKIIFEADFVQTNDVKKCVFCPYKSICNR